jgi:hypothetical protein
MSILGKITGGSIKGAVEGVSNVIDKFVHTKDEAEKIKAEIEKEITKRWQADAASSSWLSSNVRPLSLVGVLLVFFILLFTDGNIGEFRVNSAYLPIYNSLLITVVGGYFAVRTIDKRSKR